MKIFKKYPVAWIITIVVILASSVFGIATAKQDMLPVTPGDSVCDGADVLNAETEAEVRRRNDYYDQTYAAYVAVATVESLRGWEPDVYAEELFYKWDLYGNDFLLVLDIGGKESYLYHGSNYSDFDYSYYLDTYVNPSFKDGDYDDAVEHLMLGMEVYLAAANSGYVGGYDDYYDNNDYYGDGYSDQLIWGDHLEPNYAGTLILIILAVVIIFLVLSSMERRRYRTWYGRYGHMSTPTVMWSPIFFWHRPGSSWWRRMTRPRPQPRPPHNPGPRPGGGFGGGARPNHNSRPGGFGGGIFGGGGSSRPGNGFGGPSRPSGRPNGGFGSSGSRPSRPSGGFGGGGRSAGRPSRPSGGFGGGGRRSSGGGFGGGGRSRGGGGFGGGGRRR